MVQSHELPQVMFVSMKLSLFAHNTEHESGLHATVVFRQLPPPSQVMSQAAWPQLIAPSLHDPPLPHDTVQSLSEQLMVVP